MKLTNQRTLAFLIFIITLSLMTAGCSPLDQFRNSQSDSPASTVEESVSDDEDMGSPNTAISLEQSQTVSNDNGDTTASASAKATIELTAKNPAKGTTALDLLRQSGAQMELKSFGEAGQFVTSINDIAANTNNYWAFYVNDEYAQQAVDKTLVKDGDRVKFVYERIVPNP
jgi:hypothetical protein